MNKITNYVPESWNSVFLKQVTEIYVNKIQQELKDEEQLRASSLPAPKKERKFEIVSDRSSDMPTELSSSFTILQEELGSTPDGDDKRTSI